MIGLCDLCLVVPHAPRTCAWHGPRNNRGTMCRYYPFIPPTVIPCRVIHSYHRPGMQRVNR